MDGMGCDDERTPTPLPHPHRKRMKKKEENIPKRAVLERKYIISSSTKLCKEANGMDERITVTVQFITCFSTKKQRDTRK